MTDASTSARSAQTSHLRLYSLKSKRPFVFLPQRLSSPAAVKMSQRDFSKHPLLSEATLPPLTHVSMPVEE